MNAKTHWETVYANKAPDAVSWYRPHLETSLALIERAAMAHKSASIIDVGGGESTLVDDLLARGYENITVLDVSQVAIEVTKKRLGQAAERVRWITADITQVEGEPSSCDVWHDRAVFHFLTTAEQRVAYVRNVANTVRPGGNVIVSTFGPEGPTLATQPIRCALPSGGELERTASHTIWQHAAVSLLLLQSPISSGIRNSS